MKGLLVETDGGRVFGGWYRDRAGEHPRERSREIDVKQFESGVVLEIVLYGVGRACSSEVYGLQGIGMLQLE